MISRISQSLLARNNQSQFTSNDVSNIGRSVTINFPTITLNATGDSSSLFKNNSFIARSNETLNDSTVAADGNGNPSDSLDLELAGLNFQVNLEDPETLHGFAERYVAAGSVLYVVDQFRELKKTILQSVPKEEEGDDDFIDDYFSKVIGADCFSIIEMHR